MNVADLGDYLEEDGEARKKSFEYLEEKQLGALQISPSGNNCRKLSRELRM